MILVTADWVKNRVCGLDQAGRYPSIAVENVFKLRKRITFPCSTKSSLKV